MQTQSCSAGVCTNFGCFDNMAQSVFTDCSIVITYGGLSGAWSDSWVLGWTSYVITSSILPNSPLYALATPSWGKAHSYTTMKTCISTQISFTYENDDSTIYLGLLASFKTFLTCYWKWRSLSLNILTGGDVCPVIYRWTLFSCWLGVLICFSTDTESIAKRSYSSYTWTFLHVLWVRVFGGFHSLDNKSPKCSISIVSILLSFQSLYQVYWYSLNSWYQINIIVSYMRN